LSGRDPCLARSLVSIFSLPYWLEFSGDWKCQLMPLCPFANEALMCIQKWNSSRTPPRLEIRCRLELLLLLTQAQDTHLFATNDFSPLHLFITLSSVTMAPAVCFHS
jgi:hypothetical protein